MVGLLQVIQSESEGCRPGNRVRRSGKEGVSLDSSGPAPLCPRAHPSPVPVREGACTAAKKGRLEGLGVPGARTPAEKSGGGGERRDLA